MLLKESESTTLLRIVASFSYLCRTIQDLFTSFDTESWPEKLKLNVQILSIEEQGLANMLLTLGQHHLFSKWEEPGKSDEHKHEFFRQVKELHDSYKVPGGLAAYIANAKVLLESAKNGENPLAGWTPEVPTGVSLEPLTNEYRAYEEKGLHEIGTCGFVLVAGGMGERLGYSGIKVELPIETTTGTSYLKHYCGQILAMQRKYAKPGMKLPLAIMVSEDTCKKTVALLEAEHYFGLEKSQVTIMEQGKVPALINNFAEIAASGPYIIDSKPHGHGDVHSLMLSTGTAAKWQSSGVKWCVFFQDTNGLAFTTLPAMIGVSLSLELDVNSLAIPRYAKQAIGAVAKLVHTDGRQMTVNVEYNQLDPMLRATVSPEGDVNDKSTGLSIYPGNINQLLFRLDPYLATLVSTHGAISEFVNPKYSDSTKTSFKKPTRLECMMQDYPKLLGPEAKVGFTLAPSWICYSPCKNNPEDAAASAAAGVPAGSAYQAESDMYAIYAVLLRKLGATVPPAAPRSFLGIFACPGPCITISPTTAVFVSDIQRMFPNPCAVQISARSTLRVEGDVVIRSLKLDGAVRFIATEGTHMSVRAGGESSSVIRNAGYVYQEHGINQSKHLSEAIKMRGYEIRLKEEKAVTCPPRKAHQSSADIDRYVFAGGTAVVHESDYVGPEDEVASESKTSCFNPLCVTM
jgi:UDP-sugar pyrophosphorylase